MVERLDDVPRPLPLGRMAPPCRLAKAYMAASYGAESMGMSEPLPKPFQWEGALWVCVMSRSRERESPMERGLPLGHFRGDMGFNDHALLDRPVLKGPEDALLYFGDNGHALRFAPNPGSS